MFMMHTWPPTQDIEHDSLEILLPGLKMREHVAHDLVRLFRLFVRLSIRLFMRLFIRLVVQRHVFPVFGPAHVIPNLVHFDLSPQTRVASSLHSARRGATRVPRAPRAVPSLASR